MADEDKDKAEKLAAAKKRFEQLKKEQAKKGKKGGKKKKEDAGASTEEKAADGTEEAEEVGDESATVADEDKPTEATADLSKGKAEDAAADIKSESEHTARKASISLQSKQRSESFRSGTAQITPTNEVTELYQKQSQQISELKAENESLQKQREHDGTRLSKLEEEIESLREQGSENAELKSKAQETGALKDEIDGLKRQLAQAQKEAKDGSKRRSSAPSPDLKNELESKTNTIESLELEISNLKNQTKSLESKLSERDSDISRFEERIQIAEGDRDNAKQELEKLKVSMAFPSDDTQSAGEDPEALTKRINLLESDLRSANTNLDSASARAKALESKLETLTKLHKDATSSSSSKDKELQDLRDQLRKRDRPSHIRDASEFDLNEDETETGALHARIRELEAENFDMKRGVWRDQRASLQPGMDDSIDNAYEDVDLSGGHHPGSRHRGVGSLPRQGSTFQDVINSGISAFTGRPRDNTSSQPQRASHERKQSLGLLSEDEDFDPEAWQQAQEEEAKRRVERVKDIKRSLEQFRGFRVDLVDLRKNAGATFMNGLAGPVFKV